MHIVFFNRSFYPDISATSILLTELCQDLVKNYSCRVTVIAGMPLVEEHDYKKRNKIFFLIRKERFASVDILRVASTIFSRQSFLGRVCNYFSYFFLAFLASFFLKKPDVVVTLTDPPIIPLVGFWVSWFKKAPFLISVRDLFPEAARGLNKRESRIVSFLLNVQNQFCFNKAKIVVSLGESMSYKLIYEKKVKENKIVVIPDWADTREIIPLDKKNDFSVKHNISDYFVVMYAGNIGASCGLEFVLDSASSLVSFKDILFVFVGEGILKPKLMRKAKEYDLKNVRFFSYQPREIISQLFASADCFLLPLKAGLSGYSIPSKIYAILAAGRPYIASIELDSDIAKIAQQFQCGLVCPPQDPLSLKEKILFLYMHEQEKIKMGENARSASFLFDRSKGVQKYYELFLSLSNP